MAVNGLDIIRWMRRPKNSVLEELNSEFKKYLLYVGSSQAFSGSPRRLTVKAKNSWKLAPCPSSHKLSPIFLFFPLPRPRLDLPPPRAAFNFFATEEIWGQFSTVCLRELHREQVPPGFLVALAAGVSFFGTEPEVVGVEVDFEPHFQALCIEGRHTFTSPTNFLAATCVGPGAIFVRNLQAESSLSSRVSTRGYSFMRWRHLVLRSFSLMITAWLSVC